MTTCLTHVGHTYTQSNPQPSRHTRSRQNEGQQARVHTCARVASTYSCSYDRTFFCALPPRSLSTGLEDELPASKSVALPPVSLLRATGTARSCCNLACCLRGTPLEAALPSVLCRATAAAEVEARAVALRLRAVLAVEDFADAASTSSATTANAFASARAFADSLRVLHDAW
jgi:hypothetical protein